MPVSPPNHKLTDFKVLVFDVYGTLIDWESAIYTALQPILSKYPASASQEWSRKEALIAYASIERDLQAQHPQMLYSDLLCKAHQLLETILRSAADLPLAHVVTPVETAGSPAASSSEAPPDLNDDHATFAKSIKNWQPFPDTVDALHTLAKHFKLVVLSNVDRNAFSETHAMLSKRTEMGLLHSPFTLILTAQDTLAYKPSLVPLTTALNVIASMPSLHHASKEEVLVVAQSLYHDHVPAKALGVKSVCIEREPSFMGAVAEETVVGGTEGGLWTWRFSTLGELVSAVEREISERVGRIN